MSDERLKYLIEFYSGSIGDGGLAALRELLALRLAVRDFLRSKPLPDYAAARERLRALVEEKA